MPIETAPRVDPLAMPGIVRILLSETASRHLLEAGEAFAIVSKASYPEAPGRVAIFCQAVPLASAQAACDVLTGKARAVRIPTPKPPKAPKPGKPEVPPRTP